MLERRFVSAEIRIINPTAYKLSLCYSYYSMYNFKDVFVYKTLAECKDKLIIERCGTIKILDEKDNCTDITVGPG